MVQKTIQDYYDQICEEYPNIPRQDIKRILQYGWKSLYLHNSYGGDTLINRNGFWFYCGQLMNDSLKYFEYYKKKMRIKLRIMYKRKRVPWDGYYYFALTQNQYNEYLGQKIKEDDLGKGLPFLRSSSTKYTTSVIYQKVIGWRYLDYRCQLTQVLAYIKRVNY